MKSRFLRACGLALAGSAFSGAALAALGLNHAFNPSTVVAGQPATLTVNLINQNDTAASGTALAVPLAGLTVTNAQTNCGSGTATLQGSNLQLTGGTVPARVGTTAGACTITA
ncbi:MAG: hypothetical protein Q4G71_07815 [Pseudomonadota bacterium]|nr:hypothetical protein [Pseudomonadota bacterium]